MNLHTVNMSSLKYVRPLDKLESENADINAQGVALIGYQLHLKFRQELDTKLFKRALDLLQRKNPVLNLCIHEEDGKKFFYEKHITDLDFEVCCDKNLEDVRHEVLNTIYDASEGPLWRSRLLLPPIYSEEDEYPFGYNIVLGFHHAITDGTTNCKSCGAFIRILNGLIEGNNVIDDPIGELRDTEWFEKSSDNARAMLLSNPELLSQKRELFQYIKERISPFQITNPLSLVDKTVRHLRILNEECTTKLLHHFKQHNVTFHSGFTACVNWTLLEVFKRHMHVDTFSKLDSIACTHVVNNRRYDKRNEDKLGSQMGIITSQLDVNKNFMDFWKSADIIKQKLKELLNNESSQIDEAARQILKTSCFDLIGNNVTFDYSTSNLGNIDKYFPKETKHVQCDSIFRIAQAHGLGIVMILLLHTFQNRFYLTFSHGVKDLSEDVGTEYVEGLMLNLQRLAENGTL